VSDDGALARRLAARLEELGVTTTEAEAAELALAYPALEAWARIASDLAEEQSQPPVGDLR
jgi:hypothetical protein